MFSDIFTTLPFACALFVALFGVFVLVKGKGSVMNQLLFGFCLSMFFWMFGTFMMFYHGAQDVATAIFWDRFVYIGVIFMPPLMHHFSIFFSKITGQKKTLVLNYGVAILFLLISRSPLFVDGLYVYSWGAHSQAQIFHHVFLLYFFIGTGLFFFNLYGLYKKVRTKKKSQQIVLVFLAFAEIGRAHV